MPALASSAIRAGATARYALPLGAPPPPPPCTTFRSVKHTYTRCLLSDAWQKQRTPTTLAPRGLHQRPPDDRPGKPGAAQTWRAAPRVAVARLPLPKHTVTGAGAGARPRRGDGRDNRRPTAPRWQQENYSMGG